MVLTVAGRHDRDAVRRLGAGRAVVGAAGRVLPGAAGPGAERAAGLGRLPRLGRGAAAGRRRDAPPARARATSTSSWAAGPGRTSTRRWPRARRCSSGCCCWSPRPGKSALVPFSGWLPRAMEGPTPSSAVFYGALSVHLGRSCCCGSARSWRRRSGCRRAVVALGLATAVFAYLAGSVQTDIKSALSFASLSQVGLIVAEIGLGFRYLALIHLLGHACLRTLQFLRAPTLLHDYHTLENAIGEHLPRPAGPLGRLAAGRGRAWLYRFALERGYLDSLLTDYVVGPVRPAVPLVRRAGAPLDRLPLRRGVARVGPGQAPLRNDRRVAHEPAAPALARAGDRDRAGRRAVRQPAARPAPRLPLGPGRSPAPRFACTFLAWLAFYLAASAELVGALERAARPLRPASASASTS